MLQALFHAWERKLAAVTTDRVVRPFEWGLDWMQDSGAAHDGDAPELVGSWVADVMADTDAFYTPPPTTEYALGAGDTDAEQLLTFPSAMTTPHRENNVVYGRLFHPRPDPGRMHRAAVVVLPQWNSDAGGHVGLSKLLAMHGLTALRLSLPYHDRRMPPELRRADYIVSSNIVRTLQVCRQAVLDARRAIAWLHAQGYDRIGILGSSLGSCLSLLTTAHEPLVRVQALNHISPYFADVVWRGISTAHVREGLDGHIELDLLRDLWQPISPANFLERLRDRQTLLVYARYDLTFPVDLSRELVRQFEVQDIPHELAVLRCGHYTTGVTPFKFIDGLILSRFLRRALLS
jgi:pimeloyl-ACP methyl ester carboxylesterase